MNKFHANLIFTMGKPLATYSNASDGNAYPVSLDMRDLVLQTENVSEQRQENLNEIWKDVVNYEGVYKVSSFGRVKSLNYKKTGQEKILIFIQNSQGYFRVPLCKNGKVKLFRVHRLVAEAFIPNPNGFNEVNHKDENITNNCVDNLEWCSSKYNSNYGTRNKRISKALTNGKTSKSVLQYSLDGRFIAEYLSVTEIERVLGFSHSCICNCCNYKIASSHGYIWRYKEK